ncbi:hypothetical protein niasHT_009039 [Heterodera trifolii]|uniref:Uncharacterized protein n=1 Tax=Heterodera trifolii TaxID=157864 RepID=A0ABD2M220_9BILA
MGKIAEQFLLRNVVVETTAVSRQRRRRDVRQQRNAVQRYGRGGTVLGSDIYAQRKISSSRGKGRVGKQYMDQQTVLAVHRQQMNTQFVDGTAVVPAADWPSMKLFLPLCPPHPPPTPSNVRRRRGRRMRLFAGKCPRRMDDDDGRQLLMSAALYRPPPAVGPVFLRGPPPPPPLRLAYFKRRSEKEICG